MVNKHTDLCTRAQALTLAEIGHSMHEIMTITNLAWFTIYWYKFMAQKWGYDSTISHILKDEYLVDDPKSERPFVLIEKCYNHTQIELTEWVKHKNCVVSDMRWQVECQLNCESVKSTLSRLSQFFKGWPSFYIERVVSLMKMIMFNSIQVINYWFTLHCTLRLLY